MKKLFHLPLLLVLGWAVAACGGGDDPEPEVPTQEQPTLATPTVSAVTEHTATLSASVSGTTAGMTRHGFCYGTAANPDITAQVVSLTSGWTGYLTTLEAGTTYYVRAFLTNAQGTFYSAQTTFTTAEAEAVDPLENYVPPTYADNYTGIASWSDRARWNLANVHDPTVMKADDGYYYMYQTDASYGNAHEAGGHFHGRRSRDLVNWEYLGGTMQTVPSWVKDSLNAVRVRCNLPEIANPSYGYWAPCARRVSSNLYRMYYCIVVDNYIKTGKTATNTANFDNSWGERAFIGVMETSDPAKNQWEDKGYVLCSSSDKSRNWTRPSLNNWDGYFKFNAIDPSYIITPQGEHWLIYGSWHSGFAAVQLNPATGKPAAVLPSPFGTSTSIAPYGKLVNTRRSNNRWQGSEAPEVVYHDGYYYLFMAYDELAVAYNTRVVRSENIDGPYYGINGTNVTTGGDAYPIVTHPYKFSEGYGWVGISHCAVFDDGQGNWFYSSQGRFPADVPGINASNAIMLGHVRSIRWNSAGWPVVMPERYGAVPQVPITEADIVGTWEHIDLGYDFGKQKTASQMVFAADHTISSGTWRGGTWSFDPSTNTLMANGVELLLQRECDWEANPRRATIVYAGINGTKTYWGKKR